MAIRKGVADDPTSAMGPRQLEQADLGERYRLRGKLRRRSGSPVLLAVDEADGQLVTIKGAVDAEPAHLEADVLEALDHPGVVRLRERLELGSEIWLVLDYLPGDSLETQLRNAGPMAPDAVEGLLRELADALAHIHAHGFLHRDLKPANVLIGPDGRPVIIDFGAARPADRAGRAEGTSALTEGYAAPEQYLEGEAEGPWTDLYALAALGYRALTGEAPPPALDRLERGAPLDLSGLKQAPGLVRALEQTLALDATARPQTAGDFLALLDADPPVAAPIDDDEGLPTVRIKRRPGRRPVALEDTAAPPERARRFGLLPWLAVLALILAGIAGAFAARPLYDRHVKTTWLVDAAGEGDATTIGEALGRAGDGARVVVRPGTYQESLVLERPAHLVAADDADPPVIAPEAGPCLLTTASGGSLQGFALEGSETAGVACLAISGGDLRVLDSRITATAGPTIEVRAGAVPEIRGGEIRGAGVVIREGAQPVVSGVTIDGIAGPSVVVRSGALPEVTGNRILGSGPVIFAEGSGGLLSDNQIEDARSNGVEITSGATPTVTDNVIAQSKEAGVFVYGEGHGQFEANRIEDSGLSAIVLGEGAQATLVRNQLTGSGEHGILVLDGASAVIEGNVIEGSRGRGVAVAPDAEAELSGNRFAGNRSGAILDARSDRGSADGGA